MAMPGETALAGDDAFGADLYRLLSGRAHDLVFSPVSVASVLQMALCGARGQTAAELAGALHLDGSPEGAAAAVRALPALAAGRALGAVRPAAAARLHRRARPGRGGGRLRRSTAAGASRDQPGGRRADR